MVSKFWGVRTDADAVVLLMGLWLLLMVSCRWSLGFTKVLFYFYFLVFTEKSRVLQFPKKGRGRLRETDERVEYLTASQAI